MGYMCKLPNRHLAAPPPAESRSGPEGTAMSIVGITSTILVRARRSPTRPRFGDRLRWAPALVAATALLVGAGAAVDAAIVPTVDLATAGDYSVLAGETVTNTGDSVLAENAGVSPGS